MDVNTFLSIGLIGVVLSFIIEAIQRTYGTSSMKTRGLSILLSIVVGGGYFFLSTTLWWADIVGILAAASTTYAMLFSSKPSTDQAAVNAPQLNG